MEREEEIRAEVDKYVAFVSETIERFNKIGDLVTGSELSISKITKALADYYNVCLTLNAEYQRLKMEKLVLDLTWQETYAQWFQESKEKLIQETEKKNAKPALKEVEMRVQFDHKDAFMKFQIRLKEAEAKCDFYVRMRETLNKYDGILVTIARLMQSEIRSISIEERANAREQTNSILIR